MPRERGGRAAFSSGLPGLERPPASPPQGYRRAMNPPSPDLPPPPPPATPPPPLEPDPSDEAIAEADRARPSREEAEDLRSLPWSSIDNSESRDLDQIEVAERLGGGDVRVRIGVADVDTLVRRGSATDKHAAENT